MAEEHKLLSNKTVAVDSTYLEANAAMKSIVRKETGEDWKKYVKRLAEAEGVEIKTDEDFRKYDKTRKNKEEPPNSAQPLRLGRRGAVRLEPEGLASLSAGR